MKRYLIFHLFLVSFTTVFAQDKDSIIDIRDGQIYKIVKIGQQWWMQENLDFGTRIDQALDQTNNGIFEKYYYNNSDSLGRIYGALYQLRELLDYARFDYGNPGTTRGLCPCDWHLPTDSEWTELTDFLGGLTIAGGKLKEVGTEHWLNPNTGATNLSGFTALPGGTRNENGGNGDLGTKTYFLSSSLNFSATAASIRELSNDIDVVVKGSGSTEYGFSARCLTDSSQYCSLLIINEDLFRDGKLDFGYNKYSDTLIIVNTNAGKSVSITSVEVGTPFFQLTISATALTPGDSVQLIVFFNPSEEGITLIDTIQIETDDSYNQSISIQLSGHRPPADTITDSRDGLTYNIVKIGQQWWMAENLRATEYSDGTPIPFVENDSIWNALRDNDKAYCYYNNNDSLGEIYGALYTWAAAMNGAASSDTNPSMVQGVCPSGWHLPSDDEWMELEMFLGMSPNDTDTRGWRGTFEGGNMKESGTSHWNSPNTGASNSSGFTAIPGGTRFGNYYRLGQRGIFWTSTEYNNYAWTRILQNDLSGVNRAYDQEDFGNSVRCVKDFFDTLKLVLHAQNTSDIGESDGTIDLTISGGREPYRILWSTDDTIEDLSGLLAGIYSVMVTDSRDSTLSDSIRIYDSFIDERDSTRYRTVIVGSQMWMADNLNIGQYVVSNFTGSDHSDVSDNEIIEKYCIANEGTNCDIYGGLYDWNEMMQYSAPDGGLIGNIQGVCPTGWHVPSDYEFKTLEIQLGMSASEAEQINWRGSDEGGKLKETGLAHWDSVNTGATNKSGFSAIGSGYRGREGAFTLPDLYSHFWTETPDGSVIWGRTLFRDHEDIKRNRYYQNTAFAVRCVRDFELSIKLEGSDTGPIGSMDGSIDLTVEGGLPPFSYLWSNSSTDEDISGLPGGMYTVTVIDSRDSIKIDSIRIYNTFVDERDSIIYRAVKIGHQWWMAENLRAITYSDGTPLIDGAFAGDISGNDSTKYYFWYNNDSASYAETCGAVYTWAAAMNGSESYDLNPSVVQGICPSGWYIPSDADWKELEIYLGMNQSQVDGEYMRGTDEGGKLKESGLTHWNSPNTGATNSSGFTALPMGRRYPGSWGGYPLGDSAYLWSSTQYDDQYAWFRGLNDGGSGIIRFYDFKEGGLSVRCVREADTLAITFFPIHTTSIDGNDGAIDLTVTGGFPPYEYMWSNGEVTEDISGLCSGVYSVTVTDLMDKSVVDSIRIYDTFLDERDSTIYKEIKIGNQIWMAENLNYDAGTGTLVHSNDTANARIYGRLYDWEIAQGVSPSGWHLPSDSEWMELELYLGVSSLELDSIGTRGTNEGTKLKSTSGWKNNGNGTNESGFSALPGGLYLGMAPGFLGLNSRASFWTSRKDGGLEYGRFVDGSDSGIVRVAYPPSYDLYFSVRCVLDNYSVDSLILNKEDVSCNGGLDGRIDLTVFGEDDYSYLWSTGDTTEDISNLSAGWYKVIVNDDFGFSMSDSIQILQPDPLFADITDSVNISCYGGSDGETIITPSGGTAPYSYQWNDNLSTTTAIVTGLTANKWYVFEVMDANSCITRDSVLLSEPSQLQVAITDITDISCYGFADGTATATTAGGIPPYQYQWNDDHSTTDSSTIGLAANQDYFVNVTDANGCTSQAIVNISQPEELKIQGIVEDITCKGLCDGSLEANVSGGTSPYTIRLNDELFMGLDIFHNLCSGIYTLEVVDANGCVKIEEFEILEPDLLHVELSAAPTCNNDSSGIIISGVVGGTPPYSYLWDNNLITPDLSGLKKGVYTLSVADVNNCMIHVTDSIVEHQKVITRPITGHSNVIAAGIYLYSVNEKPASIFTWTINGGNIVSGQGTNFINVQWGPAGIGLISVIETDEHGCKGDTVSLEILIGSTGFNDIANNKLLIYPNPIVDIVTIELPNPNNESYQIAITNLTGKVLRLIRNITREKYEFSCDDLPPGVYIIEIRRSKIYREKIIIE